MLTQEQKDFYEKNGFLKVPKLYSKEQIAAIRTGLLRIFSTDDWKKNPYNTEKCLVDLYGYFPEFLDIILTKEVVEVIKDLLGENPIMFPEYPVHFREYAGGWHKDATTQHREGHRFQLNPTHRVAKFGIYLQDNNEYGGGLTVIPGSHKTSDEFAHIDYSAPRPLVRRGMDKAVIMIKNNNLYKYSLLRPFIDWYLNFAERTDKRVNPHGGEIYDIPSEAGDFLIFDHLLDHRGTFPKICQIKDIPEDKWKLSIFHVWGRNNDDSRQYMDFLRSRPEPFYQSMAHKAPPANLVKKGQELGFTPW
ncbi:MAG: phytanoyl-CoA dioxygenase family protein [Chitinophagales bacterium]